MAAEAPVGSHQVLATKKSVLATVISQITQRITSPMYQDPLLRLFKSAFPENIETDATAQEWTEVYHSSI